MGEQQSEKLFPRLDTGWLFQVLRHTQQSQGKRSGPVPFFQPPIPPPVRGWGVVFFFISSPLVPGGERKSLLGKGRHSPIGCKLSDS